MIAKLIFNIGQQIRNPTLNKWYSFLKKSESWTLEELEAYQLKKLKELVADAYNYSKFYNTSFKKTGIKPQDIQCLNDIKKLPIVTKQELIVENNNIQQKLKRKKYFTASTSGTTGNSLTFKREETVDSFNRASIFRGYSWYNIKPWNKNGYFWGYNFSKKEQIKTTFLDLLQNRFRLFNFQNKQLIQFVNKLNKAVYVHGYSSAIYETAKKINNLNLKKPLNLKMVKGTSEKIFDSYQNEIKKAFGKKMISEYGAAETGLIAFECSKGAMHINMEGVIVEVVNEEIVVTNLQMKSFPIIRYSLGDYIKLASNSKCKCGLSHLKIEEITGRIGAIVFGRTQQYPSLYFYYIFKNLKKKNNLELTYQVIQNKVGNLVFRIEQDLNEDDKKKLEFEIIKYFNKNDLSFKIEDSYQFLNENKKFNSFISKI